MRMVLPKGARLTPLGYLILTLLAVLIVASGGALSADFRDKRRAEIGEELMSVAGLKASELALWREERLSDARVVLGNPAFARAFALLGTAGDGEARGILIPWLEGLHGAYGYDRIFLFSREGRILLAVPESGGGDPAIARALPTAASPGFVDLYRDPEDGRPKLAVVARLEDGSGAIALRIDPGRYLFPYIARWPIASDTAETLLVRREGGEVLYLNPVKYRPDSALGMSLPVDSSPVLPAGAAVTGHRGVFEGADYRGIPVIAALTAIPDSPWYLVAKMDRGEVDAPARERSLLLALLVVALLGAETAGIGATMRRIRIASLRAEAESTAALKLGAERFRLAISAANIGFYDLDLRSGTMVVNEEYARILGYEPGGFRETEEERLARIHPEDREVADAALAACLASPGEGYRVEARMATASGDWRWMLLLGAVAERDAAGLPLRRIGTLSDISERKRAEAEILDMNRELERRIALRVGDLAASNRELAASNEELEAFAYSVAHDLRTPLRSIDGFSRLLDEEYGTVLGSEGKRMLGVVRASASAMDRLISELLDASRLGRTGLERKVVDMEGMARSVLSRVLDAESAGDFETSVGSLPVAWADPAMMERLWSNLFSNAVKYSLPSPRHRIRVEGRLEEDRGVWSVEDSGVGFDPRYAGKLFGMFQRLHGSGEFPGSGVGLAIVRKIANRHGGEAWAEGKPGEGAKFSFSLPAGR